MKNPPWRPGPARSRGLPSIAALLLVACAPDGPTSPPHAPPLDPPPALADQHQEGTTPSRVTVTSNAFTGGRLGIEGAFTTPIAELDGEVLAGEAVYVGRGCPVLQFSGETFPEDPYLADPAGKIALIDRGICSFLDKITRAQAAGARGVVMINDVSGDPIVMGASTELTTIPGVMVSRDTGDELKAFDPVALGEPLQVTITPYVTPPPTPEEILEDLGHDIDQLEEDGDITGGQANSLRSQLDAAKQQIDRGNARAAANILRAFIHHVQAMVAAGTVSADAGADLITQAQALLAAL